ncbi:unnamed protein product [Heligmosomoides polygyrus]|uniref:Secreted protein n=1 Tax=Heligmosomoides polygyrus TaxID=6339 RepID=A0A183FNE3_HELPZ|nr:unnamed protein product [Heligmosomoides polygyrus]
MFLVMTPNTLMQVLTIVFKDQLSNVMFINDLSYPVNDLMYSCTPWALLLTSSKLRLCIWRYCGRRIYRKFSTRGSAAAPTQASMMLVTKRVPSIMFSKAT